MKRTAITGKFLSTERLPGIPSLEKVPMMDIRCMMMHILKRTSCGKKREIPAA